MNDLQYEVRRTSRRSISVRILNDNSIIVDCPKRISVDAIEKFIDSKSKWIERHLAENNVKNEFLSEVISYKKIFVKGEAVPLIIESSAGNCVSADGVSVKSLKNLKKLYVSEFANQFDEIINQICAQTQLKYNNYSFRDYKSRWGCCDRTRELKFNWKLLMLSEEIWRYVIVHELCHTVYMNHSPKFYKLVETIMPEYKLMKRKLELCSRITKLY